MNRVRTTLLPLALPFLLAGCMLSPAYLVNRPEMERRLPSGVTMNDYVETDFGVKVSVGMKLARLGAYPGRDGKLYDLTGRQIEFFRHYDGGMPPPQGWLDDAAKHLEELKKKYTVIEILRDPDLPPPV